MLVKILDLFAGAGGFSLGFELFRNKKGEKVFELHRAVEIDPVCCKTLRKHHGDEKVIEGDLTNKEIHQKVLEDCKGVVSIVVGGIPCQSFSLLGPRSGYGLQNDKKKEDKRDDLYKEFRDIVRALKPAIIILENVKGILSKKDKVGNKIIDKIISDFEDSGYNFSNKDNTKYLLLNAADFGVPQKRERVILIGILKSYIETDVPLIKPTHCDPVKDGSANMPFYITLDEAIGDLPSLQAKITPTGLSDRQKKIYNTKNNKRYSGDEQILFDGALFKNHIESVSKGGGEFLSFIRPNGYKYIDHHTARNHQLTDIKLFGRMNEGETAKEFFRRCPVQAENLIKYDMNTFLDKYRRQNSQEPCTTVFAHLEKDGNRFIHPSQARTLTPREAARVQSFPDYYVFEGKMREKFRQIGNAVPPLLSNKIAESVYDLISG